MLLFSLKNATTPSSDCNASSFTSTNYMNWTCPSGRCTERFYDCRASTCSNIVGSYGMYLYKAGSGSPFIVGGKTYTSHAGWFAPINNGIPDWYLMMKSEVRCNGSDTTTKYCTPALRYDDIESASVNIDKDFPYGSSVATQIKFVYGEILAKGSWNGLDKDDTIDMYGSVVTCDSNCGINIQACFGNCSSSGDCIPYEAEKTLMQTVFSWFDSNEINWTFYWMIIALAIAITIGAVTMSPLGAGVGFILAMILGATQSVLPIWITASILAVLIPLLILFVIIKIIGGGK